MQSNAHRPPEQRARRLLWFVFLYVASLTVFAAVVYGLRAIVKASI
jgi:hypothetical protein